MKITAKSPRYHAKRLRQQWRNSHKQHPMPASQRRTDWLVLMLAIIATLACFATAWRILP